MNTIQTDNMHDQPDVWIAHAQKALALGNFTEAAEAIEKASARNVLYPRRSHAEYLSRLIETAERLGADASFLRQAHAITSRVVALVEPFGSEIEEKAMAANARLYSRLTQQRVPGLDASA